MNKGNKVKGMIHWVNANSCIDVEINLYDRLFTNVNPKGLESFNKNSFVVKRNAKVENNIDKNNYNKRYQFERVGYFILDSKSQDKKIIFNQIVSLKDTWKNKKG